MTLREQIARQPSRDPDARKMARRSYMLVRSAILSGRLVRPETCERCSRAPGFGKDGRPLIQAHHHLGHDKPLDVVWICTNCHRDDTPKNPHLGQASGLSKLTAEQVLEIRAAKEVKRVLAERYGVTKNCIQRVRNKRDWKWL